MSTATTTNLENARPRKSVDGLAFDTNVLNQGWPSLSIKSMNLIEMSGRLGIAIIFPKIVVAELDQHWHDHINGRLTGISSMISELNDWVSGGITYKKPRWAEFEDAYHQRKSATLRKCQASVSAHPDFDLEQLIDAAVARRLVFKDRGCNLQDTVYFLSAVQHSRDHALKSIALVTDDKVFKERLHELSEYAAAQDVALRVWTATEAADELRKLLDSATQAEYFQRKDLAMTAVLAAIPRLQHEIQLTLDEITAVPPRRLQLDHVKEVDVSLFDESRPGIKATMSAVFDGSITIAQSSSVDISSTSLDEARQILVFPCPAGTHIVQVQAILSATYVGAAYEDVRLIHSRLSL